jgi:hypothetical protein
LWIYRHTRLSKPVLSAAEYPFAVNKIRPFAHYAFVRNDSDAREREEGSIMAKAALKKKAVAKKKKPMKKVASKKRATKRRARR